MSLALDEPSDADEVIDIEPFKFVVEKELLEQAKPIKVDMTYMGFEVSSSMDLGAGAGGCGSSCGSCSC